MNNYESEFKKATELLKGVRLSETEKSSMLQSIYRETGAASTATPSPFSFASFFQNHRYASAFAVVVLLMSGTAQASFSSLPGDPLYGIKVNVIEPVALAVRLDESAKNEYRVAVLQERVEEIQKLKTDGRLTYEVETISSVIAKENLAQIESSAMFTATGTNLKVSGQVETYNSLVDEVHRLKTIIQVKPNDGEDEEDNEKEEEAEDEPASIIKPVDNVASTLEDETKETVKGATDAAAAVVEPVTKEIPKALTPLTPLLDGNVGQ